MITLQTSNSIFIYGNVPSSKNSKIWTGKILINSKYVRDYLKIAEKQFQLNRNRFLKLIRNRNRPLHIKFRFVRKTKQKFDFINLAQIIQDLMVKYEWIDDDDYRNIVPYFEPRISIDSKNYGVEISIIN